jgi:hypothetical protein
MDPYQACERPKAKLFGCRSPVVVDAEGGFTPTAMAER